MDSFLEAWARASLTSLGYFWKALWAFVLGYTISSMIQVFVTRARMQRAMGETGPRSVAIGSVFGFISSSCSFAALATTRALFDKGAGLVPALAFLLASTNLVIELGVVIAVFLSWHFVVAEYVGGVLLILVVWALVAATRPSRLIERARSDAEGDGDDDADGDGSWTERLRSAEAWRRVARQYFMEWKMVVKDVTIGFAAAGAITVFVPRSFFETLFPSGGVDDPSFGLVVADTVVGPVAAFCTFIGSMGNVPLAGVLHANGVSFAGVVAFLFSDLVVLPVLRIQIGYYGWRLALYIAGVFLAAIVLVAVALHYGFAALGWLPDASSSVGGAGDGDRGPLFAVDATLFLDLAAVALTLVFWRWVRTASADDADEDEHGAHEHGGHEHGGHGSDEHEGHDHGERGSHEHGDHEDDHEDDHEHEHDHGRGHDHDHDHGGGGASSGFDRVLRVVAWGAAAWVVVGAALALLR